MKSNQSIYPDRKSLLAIGDGLFRKIIISCFVLVFIGGLNSLWTNLDYNSWHDTLVKPFFAPHPDWIVAIFWGISYTLLGISYAIIWHIRVKNHDLEIQKLTFKARRIFYLQLLVNLIVPTLFFGLNNLYLVQLFAVADLLIVLWMINFYHRISRCASLVLIPYAVWLLYASILDGTILYLNH